jgi:uncharacterized protein (UPF0332 family)
MAKAPPVHELEFLKHVPNYAELQRKLATLGISVPDVALYALHVGQCWIRLAEEHLDDCRLAEIAGARRAAFSRAYYAAYNASKAVRYTVAGAVSLKGDDHQKAHDLPNDFPDVDQWSLRITRLYENRLRADYDNWNSTDAEYSMTTAEALSFADVFVSMAKTYLNTKFGTAL